MKHIEVYMSNFRTELYLQWRIQNFLDDGLQSQSLLLLLLFDETFAENYMKMNEFGPSERGARP